MNFSYEHFPLWVQQYQWLILMLCSAFMGAFLWSNFHKKIIYYKANRVRKHGAKGERIAEQWLLKNGFEILTLQDSKDAEFECDGEVVKYRVKPDIIAENEDGPWVIEVKTGKSANPAHGDTRRQILEYAHLYPEHKVALFDADHLLFQPIYFYQEWNDLPFPTKKRLLPYFACFLLGSCLAIFAFYLLFINS